MAESLATRQKRAEEEKKRKEDLRLQDRNYWEAEAERQHEEKLKRLHEKFQKLKRNTI